MPDGSEKKKYENNEQGSAGFSFYACMLAHLRNADHRRCINEAKGSVRLPQPIRVLLQRRCTILLIKLDFCAAFAKLLHKYFDLEVQADQTDKCCDEIRDLAQTDASCPRTANCSASIVRERRPCQPWRDQVLDLRFREHILHKHPSVHTRDVKFKHHRPIVKC